MVENRLKNIYAACAQAVYDIWEQDSSGEDEEFGWGGICDRIADDAAFAINEEWYDADSYTIMEEDLNHRWVLVSLDGKYLHVDIPFGVYERQVGPYRFEKIDGVRFTVDDVTIWEGSLEEWDAASNNEEG